MFIYQYIQGEFSRKQNHIALSWALLSDWLELSHAEKTRLSALVPSFYKGPVVDNRGEIYVPLAVKAWTEENPWERGQYQGYRECSEEFPIAVTDIGQYLPELF